LVDDVGLLGDRIYANHTTAGCVTFEVCQRSIQQRR